MTQQEFRQRTDKFLGEDEIANYDKDFEPTYMRLDRTDKDDFCKMLKDKTMREVIRTFSAVVRQDQNAIRVLTDENATIREMHKAACLKVESLVRTLKLITSNCDRALATGFHDNQ